MEPGTLLRKFLQTESQSQYCYLNVEAKFHLECPNIKQDIACTTKEGEVLFDVFYCEERFLRQPH
jgi:hypothetical protein